MSDTISNKQLYEAIQNLEQKIESNFVTKDAFTPVRAIAYGLAGLAMMAVGSALVATVIGAADLLIK